MVFGPNFLRAIGTLYTNPTAYLKHNSSYIEGFPLACGTRQGCPLSPLLFTLAIEPLAQGFKNNTGIRGIHQNTFKLCTDDVILYLLDPFNSLQDLITHFSLISGFHVNLSKFEFYLIHVKSHMRRLIQLSFEYKLITKQWKCLGVSVPLDLKDLLRSNFGTLCFNQGPLHAMVSVYLFLDRKKNRFWQILHPP